MDDADLTAYAAALLVGTGASVAEIDALTRADEAPSTTAAAAVVDGWHSADEGEHT